MTIPYDEALRERVRSHLAGHDRRTVTDPTKRHAAVAVVLFPRVWVIVAGAVWVVLMAFSRTYLHAHWASDTLGGALLGTGAVLVVAALYAPRLRAERVPVTG